jgi:hypothetical protein
LKFGAPQEGGLHQHQFATFDWTIGTLVDLVSVINKIRCEIVIACDFHL